MATNVPQFRWRIVPATILAILGVLVVGMSVWNALMMPSWAWSWTNHGIMALAGILFVVAAVAWYRSKWWLAAITTVLGLVLPTVLPIMWP